MTGRGRIGRWRLSARASGSVLIADTKSGRFSVIPRRRKAALSEQSRVPAQRCLCR